jgi:hypothetical protein
MKLILSIGIVVLASTSVFALDLKESIITAAKDKKNQEQAKEIAQKGIDYIKEQKQAKTEVKAEPVVAPAVVAAVPEKEVKPKAKKKRKTKK